jgi:hypothetical protein
MARLEGRASRWEAAAGLGAAALGAAGVVGGLVSGVAGAASLSSASQLLGSDDLCVVGSDVVLTVMPASRRGRFSG